MKKLILAALLLPLFVKARIVTTSFTIPNYGTCNMLVYLPDNAVPDQKLPCFLFIPGNGEVGTNINELYINSPMGFIRNGWKPSFMIAAAQPLQIWPNNVVMRYALNHLKTFSNFDINRWYGTGLSGGAGCNYDYILTEPDATYTPPKACIPMSLAISTQCGSRFDNTDYLCGTDLRFLSIPMWGFGGNNDSHGLVEQHFFDVLKRSGANVRFTLYPGGHCCWGSYYNPDYKELINGRMMNIYEWALQFPALPPLPVKLISFTGTRIDPTIRLQWKVANETLFDYYQVERSLDGRSFTSIGNVPGTGQDQYEFVDPFPLPGINYYRIRMVDRDGSFSYSKVVSVISSTQLADIEVYTVSGQLIARHQAKTVNQVRSLYSGKLAVMVLAIKTKDGKVQIEKLRSF